MSRKLRTCPECGAKLYLTQDGYRSGGWSDYWRDYLYQCTAKSACGAQVRVTRPATREEAKRHEQEREAWLRKHFPSLAGRAL